MQLQNLARDSAKTDEEAVELATRVVIGEPVTALDLKKLVRSMFLGPFTVCDYSAIEARVLAWLAGEQWVLDAFLAGRDIYIETASRMFGVDYEAARKLRQKGKVAVLALGYGGGLASMRAMGADGSDDEVKMHIQQWRARIRISSVSGRFSITRFAPGVDGLGSISLSVRMYRVAKCKSRYQAGGRSATESRVLSELRNSVRCETFSLS